MQFYFMYELCHFWPVFAFHLDRNIIKFPYKLRFMWWRLQKIGTRAELYSLLTVTATNLYPKKNENKKKLCAISSFQLQYKIIIM